MRGLAALALVAGCGSAAAMPDAAEAPADARPPLAFSTIATIPTGMFARARQPTGIAAVDGTMFVGLNTIYEREIAAIDAAGLPVTYAPGDPAYGTSILGLAATPTGDIYFTASNAFRSEHTPDSFVYRIAAGGGLVEVIANLGPWAHPQGIDIDGDKLYVADLVGRVHEIDAAGNSSIWATTTLLGANPTACGEPRPACDSICGLDAGGAQGITHDASYRYVSEPDHGAVVRIPINADGTAGTAELLALSCAELSGIIGIAVESPGVLIGVVTRPHSAIVEISEGAPSADTLHVGKVATLHSGAPLGQPFGITRNGDRWAITDWSGPGDQGRVLSFSIP